MLKTRGKKIASCLQYRNFRNIGEKKLDFLLVFQFFAVRKPINRSKKAKLLIKREYQFAQFQSQIFITKLSIF